MSLRANSRMKPLLPKLKMKKAGYTRGISVKSIVTGT